MGRCMRSAHVRRSRLLNGALYVRSHSMKMKSSVTACSPTTRRYSSSCVYRSQRVEQSARTEVSGGQKEPAGGALLQDSMYLPANRDKGGIPEFAGRQGRERALTGSGFCAARRSAYETPREAKARYLTSIRLIFLV